MPYFQCLAEWNLSEGRFGESSATYQKYCSIYGFVQRTTFGWLRYGFSVEMFNQAAVEAYVDSDKLN